MARRATSPTAVPSETWRMLAAATAQREPPPTGLDRAWNSAAGRLGAVAPRTARYLREAEVIVERGQALANESDARLRDGLNELRERFRLGADERCHVREAYAAVSEAAVRTLGLRPHPEQVAAGLAIADGSIVEMATGEGKTLAVTLPAVVAGWRGRGCHVLTANDYLACRDAETMKPIYDFCGLRVTGIDPDMEGTARQRAYRADITYCTNKDVAADFLRDRLMLGERHGLVPALLAGLVEGRARGADGLLLRGLDTAIVDEADSILVDEAVTPLIISGEAPNAEQVTAYESAADLARQMEVGSDFTVDHRRHEVRLTSAGRDRLDEVSVELGGVFAGRRRREELVVQALTARELFLRDRQYVVEDGEVVIVDESTGRLMPDRSWRSGLHQAVEAKEGLELSLPKETLARISFQRFFRMYPRLAGMTGTAWEVRHELWHIFGLRTVVLPTHRPCRREMKPDRFFLDAGAKWDAVLEEVVAIHRTGRPVLVGTRSIDASQRLGRRLAETGLEHQVLNAVRHAEEAEIVARAGVPGAITVATNMAGRGTDIKLGADVRELGGLHVIATERHESGRVDRQLFGRSARQGDPGSAVAFASLDDEICLRHVPSSLRRLAHLRGDGAAARTLVLRAQRRAERAGTRQREAVLRTDDWLDRFLGFAGRES